MKVSEIQARMDQLTQHSHDLHSARILNWKHHMLVLEFTRELAAAITTLSKEVRSLKTSRRKRRRKTA